jgi:mono/diheme cytochrome c family protein
MGAEEVGLASDNRSLIALCMILKMAIRRPASLRRGAWIPVAACLLAAMFLFACDVERRKSDAELGLNDDQAAGRRTYDAECGRCHEAYSTRGKKGPSLNGIFKHKYLSLSGLPANDERATDIVRNGRNEMPAYGQKLSSVEIQQLLAYLHTL